MPYLVRARVRPGGEQSLVQAIEQRTLGKGSVAGGEYLRNMQDARLCSDSTARWVEVCYCPTPLQEKRPTRSNTSSWSRCRMRMTAGSAGTRTDQIRGPARTAIAPSGWNASWLLSVIRS
jgi:hypothetical protein